MGLVCGVIVSMLVSSPPARENSDISHDSIVSGTGELTEQQLYEKLQTAKAQAAKLMQSPTIFKGDFAIAETPHHFQSKFLKARRVRKSELSQLAGVTTKAKKSKSQAKTTSATQLKLMRERGAEPRDFNDLFTATDNKPHFNDGHDFQHANDEAYLTQQKVSTSSTTQMLEQVTTQELKAGRWASMFAQKAAPNFFDGHQYTHNHDVNAIHPEASFKAAPITDFHQQASSGKQYWNGHNAF